MALLLLSQGDQEVEAAVKDGVVGLGGQDVADDDVDEADLTRLAHGLLVLAAEVEKESREDDGKSLAGVLARDLVLVL